VNLELVSEVVRDALSESFCRSWDVSKFVLIVPLLITWSC
jgi:hypothetical protein